MIGASLKMLVLKKSSLKEIEKSKNTKKMNPQALSITRTRKMIPKINIIFFGSSGVNKSLPSVTETNHHG